MKTTIELPSEQISKSINTKKIALFSALIVMSVAILIIANNLIQDRTSAEYMFLLIIGIVGVSIFSINLIIGSKQLTYSKTRSPIKAHSFFFRAEEFENLKSIIERGDYSKIVGMLSDNESGIRLDLVISEDKRFAAYQIYKYIPYNYEAATDVYIVEDDGIDKFCSTVSALTLMKS